MPASLDQIYTLNNLMALLSGSDEVISQEMRRAIRFAASTFQEGNTQTSLTRCARQLLKLHWRGRPAILVHCDLRGQTHEPLWLRSQMMENLKRIAPRQDVILLVSGLRESVAATGRRWTRRREKEYAQARNYLEELCARERPFGVRLNVIFL